MNWKMLLVGIVLIAGIVGGVVIGVLVGYPIVNPYDGAVYSFEAKNCHKVSGPASPSYYHCSSVIIRSCDPEPEEWCSETNYGGGDYFVITR